MKKIISITIFFAIAGIIITGCKKADPILRNKATELADIYATIDGKGSQRLFEPRYSADKDTVYFDIPYYYPVDGDEETDLTKIILRGTIPADAVLKPSLGVVMDLTKPVKASITSGSGEVNEFVIVAKRVGDVVLRKASIQIPGSSQIIEGVIKQNEVIFYVLPGIDVSAVKLNYEINKHSGASLTQGATINLIQDVPITVTGVDNSTKMYVLKVVEPVKLSYGIGINRPLWTKSASDLGFAANMETGLAVSGNYLIMVSRTNPSKYTVINRMTGVVEGTISLPFSGLSFQVAEDSTGNFVGASWAPKNSKLFIYKWKSPFDPAPVKIVEWTNNNPAGITGDGGVGRRMNVFGDLDKDAIILATAGQSTIIYKWIIRNGLVVSNTPEIMNYQSITGGSSSYMGYYSEAQPISAAANTNYFLNYQFEIALVNGTTHERITSFANETAVAGIFHMPTAYAKFNNATYLAIVKYIDTYNLNKIQMSLFDISSTSAISLSASDSRYKSFNVFTSDVFTGTTNANGTADICITFSPDKERMQVYTLLTNGGIMAHEFTKYAP